MSINQQTQQLIDQGETSTVELISSCTNRDEIAKAVVAFLNTKGGTIIIGLDHNKVPEATLTKRQVHSLERFLRKEITPPVLFVVSLDETEYGKVIVIGIPKGCDRPFVYRGAVFVRRGSGVKPANAAQLREMVKEDTDQPRWERQVSTGLHLDDLDAKMIKQTIRSAVEIRGLSFSNPKNHLSVLNEISMTQFDELTNAADVVFGTGVSERHPQTRVRAVCYETDRAGDRFIDDQLFEGPALNIYEDAMAFFRRHVSVANTFKPGKARRESKAEYPFNSLREALINALAHRDYSSYSGSASLSIYPNRIEIWSFGHLPAGLTPKRLEQAKHESILVNPDISNVFYMNQLMERIGRGTYNIVRECDAFGMPSPKWEDMSSGVRLTLFAATEAGSKALLENLNPRQRELLRALNPGDSITVNEFLERFVDEDLSRRQARRDLAELVDIGAFDQLGSARATIYERRKKY